MRAILEHLEFRIGRNLPGDFGVNTIGGLITARLGHVARVGDSVTLRNLRFTVTRMQRNRIVEVRLQRLAEIPAGTGEARR